MARDARVLRIVRVRRSVGALIGFAYMMFATTVGVLKRGVDCTVLFTCALEEVREILIVSVLIDRSTIVLAFVGMVHGSVDGRWRGGLNNELPRDGDAMRRAVGAHDTTALSVVAGLA